MLVYNTLCFIIEERELTLSQRLNQTPPRKYLDATEALITWLSDVEEVLAETVYITDISTMEKNLALYQVCMFSLYVWCASYGLIVYVCLDILMYGLLLILIYLALSNLLNFVS